MPDFPENSHRRSVDNDDLFDDTFYPAPDLSYLNALADGDEAFVKEMITLFLDTVPELFKTLRECTMSGDFEKLRFAAHKLLPELTIVGILAAIPDVSKIENECRQLNDLPVVVERAISIINYGIDDLRKLI